MEPVTRRRVSGVSPLDAEGKKKVPPLAGGTQLQETIAIQRPPMICYRFWRDLSNLPRFLNHIESIAVIDQRRSRWSVSGPGDSYAEWDAEIIADEPGRLISWRSLQGAQIDNAGSVHYVPKSGGAATDVKVALTYNPPAGVIGEAFAKLFGAEPSIQLADDLALLKRILEGDALAADTRALPSAKRLFKAASLRPRSGSRPPSTRRL
jgi:uncharacterized membrane protein